MLKIVTRQIVFREIEWINLIYEILRESFKIFPVPLFFDSKEMIPCLNNSTFVCNDTEIETAT